jgi:hypothetical protein
MEQLVDRQLSLRQTLFMRVLKNRFKSAAAGFDAIGALVLKPA